MNRLLLAGGVAATVVLSACSNDTVAPASQLAVTMASAFSATPAGFSQLTSSYSTTGNEGAFMPSFEHGHEHDGPGFGGPGFGLGFMGGGLDGPFLGDGLRPFHANSGNCSFSAATGITCTETTHQGLTITRVAKFMDASGTVQQSIDGTTNTVVTTSTVSGTATERDGDQSVVSETSTQTVTGLAKGSAQRTVDGVSKGTENTTGTSPQGAFTSMRTTGDTITRVMIPTASATNPHPYPTAGRVARGMTATVKITGQSPTTSTRSEVITYDGSATAKVVITQNGTTQNCTLPLPHGHLTCS